MPLTKPTVLPEWAMEDEQNGINGQYNVVEPPTEKKLVGWNFKEKPNRQWWNWFQRTVSDWIAYLNERLDSPTVSLVPTWTGLTLQPAPNLFYYSVLGDKCYFQCRIVWTGNAVVTALEMTNLPFLSKNVTDFTQRINVSRGTILTNVGEGSFSGLIDPNTQKLKIWKENIATGQGSAFVAGASGELIISGFYFIQV